MFIFHVVDRSSHCVRQTNQRDEPVVSLRYSQERQSSPSDDDVALSPGEVHLDLMANLIELRAKLDQMKLQLADRGASLRESDIRPIRGRYIQLKKCYHLAKRRWASCERPHSTYMRLIFIFSKKSSLLVLAFDNFYMPVSDSGHTSASTFDVFYN